MNTGGEAAEQIVRMSLEGFEVAAKITGAGAKNIAILLYSILKEEKKTKGFTVSSRTGKTKTPMRRSMSSPVPRTHRKSVVSWNALILLRWIPLLL